MKSLVEEIHEKYGWPLRIRSRGYYAALSGIQPLAGGKAAPLYRFPGGETMVSECELVDFEKGAGLQIKTVNGMEFEVCGPVTYKDFPECGRVFYCAGRSFPEEIVIAVI